MKIVMVILQISILYGLYYIGCLIQSLLKVSIPGSIIGMLILFLLLTTKVIKEKWLILGGNFLLSNLAILFVPSTVGLMNYFSFFQGKGIFSVVITLFSTFIVMFISGYISQTISTRQELKNREYERSFEA